MKISIDHICVKIPYLRFNFNHCKGSPNFLRLPKADHVKAGSVVITRSDVAILDIGLVKSVREGSLQKFIREKTNGITPSRTNMEESIQTIGMTPAFA